ncbi:MAG TPA: lytic transglycosylase domain-containing protein [Myxococcota bacterium]|nr:lytic transglycosylase domain-containing protein [Myxococcota bacterium]
MRRHKFMSLALVSFAISCSVPERPAAPAPRPIAARGPRNPADDIVGLLSSYMTGLAPFELRRTARAILVESARNHVDARLVLAVMHTESGFYNFSRSPVGALGLMQIMPATGEMLAREAGLDWSGPDDLFIPDLNVRLGTRYLALLHARYGTWQKALAAYNWGPAALDRRLADGNQVPELYVHTVYSRLATVSRSAKN